MYIDMHEALSKKVAELTPAICDSLSQTKFKYTSKALLLFISKTGYLTSSILSSCDSKNAYTASIIFRSLIEHVFRHLYIYIKALNEDGDSVGEAYYNSLRSAEDLNALEKANNFTKLVHPENTTWSTKDEHNKVFRDVSKEFEISRIFLYIVGKMDGKEEVVSLYTKDYLLQRLNQYTSMSSSVHGGPYGELSYINVSRDPKKLEATLNHFASESFMLHKSVVETTFLFAYLMDDKFKKCYEDLKNFTDNLQKEAVS